DIYVDVLVDIHTSDLDDDGEQPRLYVVVVRGERHERGAHWLRRHRRRAVAGGSGERARPAGAHPGALRRNAPVDAARRCRRQAGAAVHDCRQSALHRRDAPMKEKLTPKVVAVLAMVAVAAVLLVGW